MRNILIEIREKSRPFCRSRRGGNYIYGLLTDIASRSDNIASNVETILV